MRCLPCWRKNHCPITIRTANGTSCLPRRMRFRREKEDRMKPFTIRLVARLGPGAAADGLSSPEPDDVVLRRSSSAPRRMWRVSMFRIPALIFLALSSALAGEAQPLRPPRTP